MINKRRFQILICLRDDRTKSSLLQREKGDHRRWWMRCQKVPNADYTSSVTRVARDTFSHWRRLPLICAFTPINTNLPILQQKSVLQKSKTLLGKIILKFYSKIRIFPVSFPLSAKIQRPLLSLRRSVSASVRKRRRQYR